MKLDKGSQSLSVLRREEVGMRGQYQTGQSRRRIMFLYFQKREARVRSTGRIGSE